MQETLFDIDLQMDSDKGADESLVISEEETFRLFAEMLTSVLKNRTPGPSGFAIAPVGP
jgi:hypothetical protein